MIYNSFGELYIIEVIMRKVTRNLSFHAPRIGGQPAECFWTTHPLTLSVKRVRNGNVLTLVDTFKPCHYIGGGEKGNEKIKSKNK